MLSDELIVKIGADLDVLPLQPTSRRELDLLVSRVYESIRGAQERGATYIEIARQISASGYPIKRSTLCAALVRHRNNAAGVKNQLGRSAAKSLPAQRSRTKNDAALASADQLTEPTSSSARPRQQPTTAVGPSG